MFDKLMQTGHKEMYEYDRSRAKWSSNQKQNWKNKVRAEKRMQEGSNLMGAYPQTEIKTGLHEKSKRIFSEHLKLTDINLYQHMKKLEVEPHIFLM